MAAAKKEHAEIPDWGVDLDVSKRPGVPKEAPPHPLPGAHWTAPERQAPTMPVLKRADLPKLTPVFGTSAPPHGLSGKLRRAAYAIPDHRASHWALLLTADRVDVIESGLGSLRQSVMPAMTIALAAGAGFVRRRVSQWRVVRA